jgi:hypothetical protein
LELEGRWAEARDQYKKIIREYCYAQNTEIVHPAIA